MATTLLNRASPSSPAAGTIRVAATGGEASPADHGPAQAVGAALGGAEAPGFWLVTGITVGIAAVAAIVLRRIDCI